MQPGDDVSVALNEFLRGAQQGPDHRRVRGQARRRRQHAEVRAEGDQRGGNPPRLVGGQVVDLGEPFVVRVRGGVRKVVRVALRRVVHGPLVQADAVVRGHGRRLSQRHRGSAGGPPLERFGNRGGGGAVPPAGRSPTGTAGRIACHAGVEHAGGIGGGRRHEHRRSDHRVTAAGGRQKLIRRHHLGATGRRAASRSRTGQAPNCPTASAAPPARSTTR